MRYKLFLVITFIIVTGCLNVLVEKKLSDEYYLCPIESRYCICFLEEGKYNIRMIGPSVAAVGKNEEHIIVKVHPMIDGTIDVSNNLYYIIPLKNRVSPDGEKNYYGPYQKSKFEIMRKKIGVNDDLGFK